MDAHLFAFFVYLKKKVDKPEDFAGLKLGRSAPLCVPFFKSFGATAITVNAGEFYSALERGDGVGHPCDGITGLSLQKVAEYLLDEPVYFKHPLPYTLDISEILLLFITFVTTAWVMKPDGHVKMLGSALAPEMEKRRYHKTMNLGPIMGSGGLAIMIPPSGLAVLVAALAKFSARYPLSSLPCLSFSP